MQQQLRYLVLLVLFAGWMFLQGTTAIPESRVQGIQPGRITNTTTDVLTGEALPEANVVIEDATQGAATNIGGQYTSGVEQAGATLLIVTYLGYQRIEQQVMVPFGGELVQNFKK